MGESGLDAVKKHVADLRALLEDAALTASTGQCVKSLAEGRRQLALASTLADQIGKHLHGLERHLK